MRTHQHSSKLEIKVRSHHCSAHLHQRSTDFELEDGSFLGYCRELRMVTLWYDCNPDTQLHKEEFNLAVFAYTAIYVIEY